MAIRLYSGPLSLFSRKVEIALGEKGLAFERVMVPFSQAAGYKPKHPEVMAANPKGQVPLLVDGDLTLFDSTLILEYLEDAYPTPALLPAEARARARCRLLELTADEVLLPQVARLMYRTEPPDPLPANQRAKVTASRLAEAELRKLYETLDGKLRDRDYFCGEFSVADIAMFMTLLFAERLKGPPLAPCPWLADWFARTGKRPAVAQAARKVAVADRELSLSPV